ncbi:MAG TPA: sensor histidine kinase [Bryobacteraceae bacterium]|nr:sensor histidine kinase [Bryobacteraceae bacterium]
MPTGTLFTAAARRHAARLARAMAPAASRMERSCRALLKKKGYERGLRRALLAIAPAAFARLGSLDRFLEEVEYQGRRLAKHNVSPAEVRAVLHEMEGLADPILRDRFGPSREQLHLATVMALERAFYVVREAEAQALFGIYRAEAEAKDGDDLLRRMAAVLTRTFGARAGRIVAGPELDWRLRRPRFIERGTAAERLIADAGMRRRCGSFWSFPLGENTVIQLGFPSAYPWLPRERTLLEIAEERCRGALERTRLQAEVRRLESAARRAEEEERQRIGRELHDETAQALLLLRLQLEMMERQAQEPLAERLRAARSLAESTVIELRRLIAALSPTVVERLGMVPALRHLVSRFRKQYPAAVRLRIQGAMDAIPRRIEDVVYRSAQECLQNIARHSQASTVNLSLAAADNTIRLRVSDNGTGFQVPTGSGSMSFGVEAMRERAVLVGGRLAINGTHGKGTVVILEVPRNAARMKEDVKHSRTVD